MRNPSKKSNNKIEGYFIMIELNNKIKNFNLKDGRFVHHLFDYLKESKKKYILNEMTKPILNKAMNEITLLSALQVPDIKEDKSTEKLKRKWILAQEREKELAKVHQEGVDQGLTQEKVEEAKVNCIQLFKKYFPYTDTTFFRKFNFYSI